MKITNKIKGNILIVIPFVVIYIFITLVAYSLEKSILIGIFLPVSIIAITFALVYPILKGIELKSKRDNS